MSTAVGDPRRRCSRKGRCRGARPFQMRGAAYPRKTVVHKKKKEPTHESNAVVHPGLRAAGTGGCATDRLPLASQVRDAAGVRPHRTEDRKSTRLNSSHVKNSYAVFCL